MFVYLSCRHVAIFTFILLFVNFLQAQDMDVEEVVVRGVKARLDQKGALSDAIIKTEVIGMSDISDKNAVNLSEALEGTPGVRVNNECSMCGVKRILLNGLKGEQTTILVDGLPSHTLISGFYAVDAIPTTGIERVEVARGAGASLISPEAIGGTINIVTVEAQGNGATIDLSAGENGYKKASLLATAINEAGTTRATLISQYDVREQFDADGNKVSESPFLESSSIIGRVSHDVGLDDNITLRYAHIASEIFGGPVLGGTFGGRKISGISDVLAGYDDVASDQLFEENNVQKRYTGKAWETTEWIKTERDEFALSWLHEINKNWNLTLSSSYAKHRQDSFYEGFDYQAVDEMFYVNAKFNWIVNNDHLMTFGADTRHEALESSSHKGMQSAEKDTKYVSDSFKYRVTGVYVQDTWQLGDAFELSMALRVDQIRADFTDPSKPGVEIDEVIASPRFDMRYSHSDFWTSRLSGGRGYRAPLSFFESDHGILDADAGFKVDINQLERSYSGTYALSYENYPFTMTTSVAYTEVAHLAALSETADGTPLLTQLKEKAKVTATDVAMGYQVTEGFGMDLVLEAFFYNRAFKNSYAIAPADKRVTFSADWDIDGWDLIGTVVWYGAKDLKDYNYKGYNQKDAQGNVIVSSKKTMSGASYFVLNTKISKVLTNELTAYVGANNVLNETQTGSRNDSPLMYGADGAYDVAYIYGGLRGREAYAGLTWAF